MAAFRCILVAGFLSFCSWLQAEDVGSSFTYQGELQQSGAPANGTFDFQFDLFNVETAGSPLTAAVFVDDVVATEGLFTVELDFGSATFADEKLFLEIAVRDGASGGGYTPVAPRQAITPTPFAIQAQSVPDGSITSTQIDATSVQARVSGACSVGNVVRVINQDGSVVCEPSAGEGCSISACDDARDSATLTCGDTSALVNCIVPGKVWTSHPSSDESSNWRAVTFGDGLFVAVSTGPGARVMTSPDGFNWTSQTAFPVNNWQDVTHGDGLFVTVSDSSGVPQVLTSPDGINWTESVAASTDAWESVTFGNGLFVAVASGGGPNRVMTSPDGITWTIRIASEFTSWSSVTFGGGLFVAVSTAGTNQVMTSPDGINWTSRTAPQPADWRSVTHGDGLFVAVGHTFTNLVMTSPDGITWTARTAAESNDWNSVTYGDGLFVAVANDGANRVMTSPDGITWTPRTAAQANSWSGVTFGNGLFVAVSVNGGNRVMTAQ